MSVMRSLHSSLGKIAKSIDLIVCALESSMRPPRLISATTLLVLLKIMTCALLANVARNISENSSTFYICFGIYRQPSLVV